MPQFDLTQAMPQVIWLAIVFALLYLVVHLLYPRVDRVVVGRKARIAADLDEASAARDAARAAGTEGSTALADARASALAVTGKARDDAAELVRARLSAEAAKLAATTDEAAQKLARERAAALAELDREAAQLALDVVARVSGLKPSVAEAQASLRALHEAGATGGAEVAG